ncbi:hypothetical protein Pan216_27550 [Planctomycetes bacterium Pan216]|uniref:Uncharacterized protein n=1 Tax=Kolteria novifilia TaxID=2527975 RepID=A0A518B4H6_9BACT|nr:hypothetical protein Pan216_27550 [Planctomycetes bacterium Pan216]
MTRERIARDVGKRSASLFRRDGRRPKTPVRRGTHTKDWGVSLRRPVHSRPMFLKSLPASAVEPHAFFLKMIWYPLCKVS